MARIRLHGSVYRDGKRFRACVRINAGTAPGASAHFPGATTIMPAKTFKCAYGKNPRKAIAAALRKAAKHVGSRRGRFAGMGR